jgi:hypothetical protein
MTDAKLERLLRHVALPALKFGIRVQRLEARRDDPGANALLEASLRHLLREQGEELEGISFRRI